MRTPISPCSRFLALTVRSWIGHLGYKMMWRRGFLIRSPCLPGYIQLPNNPACQNTDTFRPKHHRKLLDSLPRRYCPNPKCSVLVQIDEVCADPKAKCPACFQWVCVPCKAMWHGGELRRISILSSTTDVRNPRYKLYGIPIPTP